MLILILGDSHGRLDLVHQACVRAQANYGIEAAIQVGDFGLFPKVLHKFFHEGPRRFSVPLHVIDGNHEDHGWLTTCRANGTLTEWQAANLNFHARGTIGDIGGLRIGFLGGALHADRRQEWEGQWKSTADGGVLQGKRWVPRDPAWANWVTKGDVERSIASFSAKLPDLIVSHSCPAGIGVGMVGAVPLIEDVKRFVTRAGHYGGPFRDCGEGNLREVWDRLQARPPLWIFGHFHRIHDRMVAGTRFVCVGSSDGSDGVKDRKPILLETMKRALHLDPALGHVG